MTVEGSITLHIGSTGLAVGEVIKLYAAVGWGNEQTYGHEQIRIALERTTIIVYATDRAGNLLRFARVFSDSVFHTNLAELIVHPGYQRRGIGRQLLTTVVERYAITAIYLGALEEAGRLFPSLRLRQARTDDGHDEATAYPVRINKPRAQISATQPEPRPPTLSART